MDPYQKYIAEVIIEEFTKQGSSICDLPDGIQEALKNIERRIANKVEFTMRYNPEITATKNPLYDDEIIANQGSYY